MARAKKVRPRVPVPDSGDECATLHLLFARADLLRERWLEASKNGHTAAGAEGAATVESGFGIPIWVFATLHLASLYTVVEAWGRIELSDPGIDLILKEQSRTDQLLALRNGVFHFGAVNNPSIMYVLENRDMLDWAKRLHEAFKRHLAAKA